MAAGTPSPPPDSPYRLPRTAEPRAYRLTLAPELGEGTFTGTVEIDLAVTQEVAELVANAAELAIEQATVSDGAGEQPASVALDPDLERVTFALDRPLAVGTATLRCSFTGVLNDKLRGFYRSTFVDPDGQVQTLATTQMESTDARRAFPCWDEPDRKATFEVTLEVDRSLAAYSNSAVVEETDLDDGRRRVRFAPTMKMSTYLVAFIVGPLEATEPVEVDGTAVRVLHAPGKEHLTGFALEVAAFALRFFREYFDLPYPGDKLDLAAIPDFAFGAMENLGLVTFRETALLVDTESASRLDLERVTDVVAHELAHMWFGDLVTMGWWEGIWLNEAFATFMEVMCTDAFRPAWERWVSFGLEREMALAVDGLHSTRAIEYPVGSPDEADGMFDVLTYQKGGSVLRMLEQYLGAEVFRDGARRYLRTHAYANTVTADLWNALEQASGEPVRAVMDTWILQGGHPLVRLDGTSLTQQPFTYGPPAPGTTSAIGGPWQVPVLVRDLDAPGTPAQRLLLGAEPATLAPAGLALVNAEGAGVYRTAYDQHHLHALAGRMADLEPLERADLMSDAWALVLAGQSSLEAFFDLGAALGDEEEPSTFGTVAGALGLCDRVVDDAERGLLSAATVALLGPRAAALGWEAAPGEGERIPNLRSLLLRSLGTVGADAAVRAEAARRFDDSPVNGGSTPLDANLEDAVLAVVAWQLREGDYQAVLERYRHPANPQDEVRYLYALAAFPDVDLALATFDLCLSEVRTQNAPYLIGSLLGNRVGGPAVWQRVTEDWDTLVERFPVNSLPRMLSGVSALCGDPAVAEQVTAFLGAHPLRAGQRTVDQTLERLAVNVAFGQHQRGRLASLLAQVAGAPER